MTKPATSEQSAPANAKQSGKPLDLFNELLHLTIKNKATDLYLVVGSPPMLRTRGNIKSLSNRKMTSTMLEEVILSIADKSIFARIEKDGEVNIATSIPGVARFRINIYKQRGSYCLVAHYNETRIPNFSDYEIPEGVRRFSEFKRGLLIFAGEGGSGRSTTMAAMINSRRQKSCSKIITLEDPIKYVFHHDGSIICQREYGSDFFDWGVALRNTILQSPDMVCMGAIDTYEKLSIAIKICNSGKVFAGTLVASNFTKVLQVLENLTPVGERDIVRQQLAKIIVGISCQKLVTTIAGRHAAAFEIYSYTPSMTSLIAAGDYPAIREYLSKEKEAHLQTIDDHLLSLFKSGTIDSEEARYRCESPDDMNVRMRKLAAGKGGGELMRLSGETLSVEGDEKHPTELYRNRPTKSR